MSNLPLDHLMHELATFLGTQLHYDRGIYRLSVPLSLGRRQEISASIRHDDDGRQIIAFVSTVGEARRDIDPWRLLQSNGQHVYCRVALLGSMVAVIACQLLHTAQPEEVLLMLREVAHTADQLERQMFISDQF